MRLRRDNYIEKSKNWVFRLWTMREVCEMLRVSYTEFYRLKKKGLFKAMHRRKDYEGGTSFYTDRQVFEGILYLHPDIKEIEVRYLERQITEVPADATIKERCKIKKERKTKKEARLARINERRDRGCGGSGTREVRHNNKARWKPRPGGYTDRYLSNNLPRGETVGDNREDGDNSKDRDITRQCEAESECSVAKQGFAGFNEE